MTSVTIPPTPLSIGPFGYSALSFTVDLPTVPVWNPLTPHGPEEYARQALALLPAGPAWPRDEGSTLFALLLAEGDEFARVEDRATDLLAEANPITTDEMLADWERVCGLPDECFPGADTVDARRRAVRAKLNARGGASPAYFVDLLASVGWHAAIPEYRPFRAGSAAAGDPAADEAWSFVWSAAVTSEVFEFTAGGASAGDPLRSWGDDGIECLINKLKPAHTLALFDYSAGFSA